MATPLVDRHIAEGRGGSPALRTAEGDVSYAELQGLVNRVGNALRVAGVMPEQRVAILLPDGPEFVATFIGAMKIGAVPVPMNTSARPNELRFMLDDSRARALVTDPALSSPIADGLPSIVFVVGDTYETAIKRSSPELEPFPARVDEPCYWLYSSGTTGRPKGVVHLH